MFSGASGFRMQNPLCTRLTLAMSIFNAVSMSTIVTSSTDADEVCSWVSLENESCNEEVDYGTAIWRWIDSDWSLHSRK